MLQVLCEEHPPRWARAELELRVDGVAPLVMSDALALLAADGALILAGEHVHTRRSPAIS